jgi:intracellular sulfur oxidation DsrE/DsrF family protein
MMKLQLCFLGALLATASPAWAGMDQFTYGPTIKDFGAVAKIDTDAPLAPGIDYKLDFDIGKAEPGKVNTDLDSVARLINMLTASGVPMSKIHPAVVVWGPGMMDVTKNARYQQESGGVANPNIPLVEQLIAKGVQIYVCGQAAAKYDVAKSDLLPGVKMALSGMTTHAMLHAQGYLVNP